MRRQVKDILKYDLCLGCGLCEAVSAGRTKMVLCTDGFYKPDVFALNDKEDKEIFSLCPGINIDNTDCKSNSIWGKTLLAINAWSSDDKIRHDSSSGGITSALAIYLLESGIVNGILQVRVQDGSYLYNRLYISRSRADVLKCNSSRYAPTLVFSDIINMLDSNPDEVYAFIGKPCDIAGLKNLITKYPQYKKRIKYYLSIFCAGMPSYNATKRALATFKKKEEPVSLRYRGDGWPGYFKATYKDGSSEQMTYNDSWGKILGKDLCFRCKICPDGIGMLADISSGDSWNTKNGYPDLTEADGKNFCFVRTTSGKELIQNAKDAGYIQIEELDVSEVRKIQAYQYVRRRYVGWRILVVQFLTNGILRFRDLGFYHNALKLNIIKATKEIEGTYRRFRKICQRS